MKFIKNFTLKLVVPVDTNFISVTSNDIKIHNIIFFSRLLGGVLFTAGIAALGGFALQHLGGIRGLSSGVQGLLSQENSGPQIATRFQKSIISGCVKANIFRRVEEWTRPNWE